MNEQWKDIPGYEGSYQASTTGKIKSLPKKIFLAWGGHYYSKEKILSPAISRGYEKVLLYTKGVRVYMSIHRLVALTFIEKPNHLFDVVNHKNGNKRDNRIENLEWTSQSGNVIHAYDIGLRCAPTLSEKGLQSLKEKKFKKVIDNSTGEIFNSQNEAAGKMGLKVSTLSMMLNGKTPNKTSLQYL